MKITEYIKALQEEGTLPYGYNQLGHGAGLIMYGREQESVTKNRLRIFGDRDTLVGAEAGAVRAILYSEDTEVVDIESDDDWNKVQSFVDRKMEVLYDDWNIAVPVRDLSVMAVMSDLSRFGIVSLTIECLGVSVVLYRAGKGSVRIVVQETSSRSLYAAGNDVVLLREARTRLHDMLGAMARIQQAVEVEKPKQSVLSWLAERAGAGVFEVDITQQVAGYEIRRALTALPECAHPASFQYRNDDGELVDRIRRQLATNGLDTRVPQSIATELALQDLRRIKAKSHGLGRISLDVTQSFGWMRGQFGDQNSCWWNEYNQARSVLYHMGGYALRLWGEDGEGKGRVWVAPVPDRDGNPTGALVFNAYPDDVWSIHLAAALLEHVTGSAARRVGDVYAHRSMYVNSATRYGFNLPGLDGSESATEKPTVRLRMPSEFDEVIGGVPTAWRANSRNWGSYADDNDLPPAVDRLAGKLTSSDYTDVWLL